VYLCVITVNYNKDISNILGDKWTIEKVWHYDNSSVVFNKSSDFTKESNQFNLEKVDKKNIIFFNSGDKVNNINDCKIQDTIFDKSLIEKDTIQNPLSNQEEERGDFTVKDINKNEDPKKFLKKKNKKLNKAHDSIKKESKAPSSSTAIIKQEGEGKVEGNIKKDIQVIENKTEEEVVEDNVEQKNKEIKKIIPEKPKMRDYKNSSDYQKALRVYYKLVE
jgi:hypothetical protein